MHDTVFLSGATGFLGTNIAKTLMQETHSNLIVLVRAQNDEAAKTKLEALWWEHKELKDALGKRVQVVAGDITKPHLGMRTKRARELKGSITHIIHAAADTKIHQTKAQMELVNVEGTRAMLAFAGEIHNDHELKRFSHISTAYVAGLQKGRVKEDALSTEAFGSIYEQSKFDAEVLVRASKEGFATSIFRPAQIVGDSKTGEIATFNTVYYPLKLYLKNKLRVLPLKQSQKMNIVPIDYVAKVVVRGTLDEQAANKTFHVTAPPDKQPTAGELIDEVRSWASCELGIALARPLFIPCSPLAKWGIRQNLREQITPKKKSTLSNMLALTPYFYEDRIFDAQNTEALMGNYELEWREFLPQLLSYSVQKGFLNRSSRTVFEQMELRQNNSRYPISYFDVSRSGIDETDAATVCKTTQSAVAALCALGIKAGDRVALVGINSVNHCIVDAAIGRLGAVSVPLYYTAPLEEIESLVLQSNAKALFVGSQKILDGLVGLQNAGLQGGSRKAGLQRAEVQRAEVQRAEVQSAGLQRILDGVETVESDPLIISMTSQKEGKGLAPQQDAPSEHSELDRSELDHPHLGCTQVLDWESFVALGQESVNSQDINKQGAACQDVATPQQSVAYGDVATIRYTSGTTGQPKGVLFNQYQLKWMGETLPSLLDWRSRNKKIRYLSFLPMSHVVEGILVAYAPYYILSEVEVYYLNDFHYLNEALPKVRPTIFFSVPRFYEKAWDALVATGVGRYYLSLKQGAWKTLVARVCRRGLLKKAGLDACKQLIVGSAPISLELLESYSGLGIQIYNAYGLTEAPLITLSRYGKNEPGSVGELLPHTQAKVDESGEVLICGPQVTVGYDGVGGSAVDSSGYLPTGDFGHLSAEGHLVIDGRKKELIITAYGKNINPQKIETRLKALPWVSEVLVVGDALPYCSALIWVENGKEGLTAEDEAALDEAVLRVNDTLSHPEQIKTWLYLSEALSIQKGELTPNLKLRRDCIQDTYQAQLAALYDKENNEYSKFVHKAREVREVRKAHKGATR